MRNGEKRMNENPLKVLETFGQSIWVDFISRGVLTSGQLQRWIDEDGVSGVTSNPSIFENAITGTHDYDAAIRDLARQGKTAEEIYDALTISDIQQAADLFLPVYERTLGADGFVSIEVSPYLADDTEGSIREARRLWQQVNRPNIMIKIPGTKKGLPAIQQMISEGVNINITLLFGIPRYLEVVDAYMTGLEERAARGLPLHRVSSVASFFLSRIDVLVDPLLANLSSHHNHETVELARSLQGETAIASARVAYQEFQKSLQSQRWSALAENGARQQRVLWASTSTKNPAYSDVKYVEPLIGRDTINTVPIQTLDAYRDHGKPALRISEDLDHAHRVLQDLAELKLNLDAVTQELEDEGVEKFTFAYQQLLARLGEKINVKV
jgi:transaldolase